MRKFHARFLKQIPTCTTEFVRCALYKILYLNSVRPVVKGPFVTPDGYQFASPVYLIRSSVVNFSSPVTLYLQHFIKLRDAKEFVFMIASAHSTQLDYHFEILKQDVACYSETNVCYTDLLHFSYAAGATESSKSIPLSEISYNIHARNNATMTSLPFSRYFTSPDLLSG